MKICSEAMDLEIGRILRLRRRSARITQVEMGEILGLHQTAVCRVEKGFQSLTAYELLIVCKLFKMTVERFMDPSDIKPRKKKK